MAANDAFTAGVRPGGLTNSTEIRLLLCYLVKNAGPIARQEIENALMEEALVNYFEIGSCLDDITRQQLVTVQDNVYSITDKGRKVAQERLRPAPQRAGTSGGRCAALPDLGPQRGQVQRQHHRKAGRPLQRPLHRKGPG